MKMYKETFHARIKQKRIDIGLTQSYVAAETGISQSNISKYESGDLEPSIEQLGILANFYNVTIDFLLGNTLQDYKEWRDRNGI